MLSVETMDFLAICVVTTVVAGVAGWVMAMLRRSPFSPAQSALYALNYVLTRVLWRTRIHGEFPIPPGRGAVLVCNHRCPVDPSFLALAVPRVIHWMVAQEYCEYPVFRQLLRTCEVIPVRRGGADRTAIRAAIRLVKQGELVGIFPEGFINTTDQLLLPGRVGAAMIALKAGAPVVPCYIHGSPYDGTILGCLLMPASVRLRIGPAIDVSARFDHDDRRETQDELTRQFLAEIARLAGRPDFEPQLAGHVRSTAGIAGTKRSCRPRCEKRPRRCGDAPG
jgi:1-acyl-sn-glycerol-3-phosphate acyltransferase